MAARHLSYRDALRRAERRAERKAEKQAARAEAHGAEIRARRRERRDKATTTKITHLRIAIEQCARHPSRLTVHQLRAIAENPTLPAEARVEAARLLTAWQFAEIEDIENPQVHNGRRSSRRRD